MTAFWSIDSRPRPKILFGKYAGSDVRIEGEDLMLVREDEIYAVVEVG